MQDCNKNLENFALSKILGEKKLKIVQYFCRNADLNGFVFIQIKDLCKDLDLSKPTAISTIKLLEEKNVLKKLKNGLYQFQNTKLF